VLAMTVLAAIGHTVMCEGARPGQTSGSGPHPRSWWKFSIVVVAVTFVYCVLLVSGILGDALATGAFRNVSVPILLGSFAALLTGPIALAALLAMVVAERFYGTALVEEIWNGRRSGARSVPAAAEM
jgi:hypothetical protein